MTPDELMAWLRADDARALALTMYGEARSESVEGRIAVGCVIRTRARIAQTTYAHICLAPRQFSCWNPGDDANHKHLMAVALALAEGRTPPWSSLQQAIYEETEWLVEGIRTGTVRDRVHGATHYLTDFCYRMNPPVWARDAIPVCTVGAHVFFRVP